MVVDKSNIKIAFEVQVFPELTKQYGAGLLEHSPECYALWWYYGTAYNVYVHRVRDKILYEGEAEPNTNFKQLFNNIARAYGVEPEAMIRYWPVIDAECGRQMLPLMPVGYRFDKPIIITGHHNA